MNKWQPIESAPHDGTEILVFFNDDVRKHFYVVHWDDYIDDYPWAITADERLSETYLPYWMPLPEPPVKKHYCKSKCGDWLCKTNKNTGKGLILADYRGIWGDVVACPFCGEKA